MKASMPLNDSVILPIVCISFKCSRQCVIVSDGVFVISFVALPSITVSLPVHLKLLSLYFSLVGINGAKVHFSFYKK